MRGEVELALSDSERLASLQARRDTLEALLDSGADEYTIDGMRVSRAGIVQRLDYVERQIRRLELRVHGAARNLLKPVRK